MVGASESSRVGAGTRLMGVQCLAVHVALADLVIEVPPHRHGVDM